MTKHNARFMKETGYAFKIGRKKNQRISCSDRNRNRYCKHLKQIGYCTWLQGKLHLRLHRRISFDGKFLPVDIRHSHRFCSGLSCDSSLRHRRRNIWVSYSLMRVRANTRRLACLGGRRMNGRMFGATRNCVANAFLPEVVWANLSVPVLFDTEL